MFHEISEIVWATCKVVDAATAKAKKTIDAGALEGTEKATIQNGEIAAGRPELKTGSNLEVCGTEEDKLRMQTEPNNKG